MITYIAMCKGVGWKVLDMSDVYPKSIYKSILAQSLELNVLDNIVFKLLQKFLTANVLMPYT